MFLYDRYGGQGPLYVRCVPPLDKSPIVGWNVNIRGLKGGCGYVDKWVNISGYGKGHAPHGLGFGLDGP